MTLRFLVGIHTESESNRRDHWLARHARVKMQRRAVAFILLQHQSLRRHPHLLLPATVNLQRLSPRLLDDDNLRAALKAVRDEVAKLLHVDDRSPLVAWTYSQAKHGEGMVEVTITPLVTPNPVPENP